MRQRKTCALIATVAVVVDDDDGGGSGSIVVGGGFGFVVAVVVVISSRLQFYYRLCLNVFAFYASGSKLPLAVHSGSTGFS